MIYIRNDIRKQFYHFANRHKRVECGAFLIGKRISKIFADEDFIITDIYICKEIGSFSTFTFTPESQIKARQYIAKKYLNSEFKPSIIGTIHSHGQYDAFFSEIDKSTYKRFFLKPLCFIVYSPKYKTEVVCFKNSANEILKSTIKTINKKRLQELKVVNEKLIASFCTKDGKNKYEIFEAEYLEIYYSSCLQNNKIIRFITKANLSEETKHRNEIRTLNSDNLLSEKRLLIIGAGTIGSALMTPLKGCGIKNITIVDLDEYEIPNVSRTNGIGFDIAARNEKKAIALARNFVYQSSEDLLVSAIATDITSLGFGFIKNFDAVICLADNNVVRAFAAFACKFYKKLFLQAGTTVYNGDIIGQLSIQPAISEACFCCVENANDFARLIKRTGCSQLDADVSPQILSRASELASRLVDWTVALLNKKINLTSYKRILYCAVGNLNGESKEFNIPQKSSNCSLHKILDNEIPLITCTKNTVSLYKILKENVFKTDGVFAIQMKESMLIYLFASEKEIHSILLNPKINDKIIGILPRDHIYCIDSYSNGDRKYVHIVFSE